MPLLALTGTATEEIRKEVALVLKMRNPAIFLASFNRPNLFYEVKQKSKKTLEEIGLYILSKQADESGLIYCITKKECEKVAKYLNSVHKIRCSYYHADLPDSKRKKNQEF